MKKFFNSYTFLCAEKGMSCDCNVLHLRRIQCMYLVFGIGKTDSETDLCAQHQTQTYHFRTFVYIHFRMGKKHNNKYQQCLLNEIIIIIYIKCNICKQYYNTTEIASNFIHNIQLGYSQFIFIHS